MVAVGVILHWPPVVSRISIRWSAGLGEVQRAEAERDLGLTDPVHVEAQTWRYTPTQTHTPAVERIVRDPRVEDTHYIDRTAFVVRMPDPPPLAQRLATTLTHVYDDEKFRVTATLLFVAAVLISLAGPLHLRDAAARLDAGRRWLSRGAADQSAGPIPEAPVAPPLPVVRHAVLVVVGFVALHAWFWSALLTTESYLAHSDLYEYFLPVFLNPGLTWSANEFAGFPSFADPQASMWYPVHALFSRGLRWWHGFVIAAYLIASLGAYAYVYVVSRSVAAAAFAGIAWPLCEALSEKFTHLAMLHGFAWFAVLLACLEKLLQTNAWRWMSATAFAVAMLVLSGHPQVAVYGSYFAGAYAVIGGVAQRQPRLFFLRLVGAFVLGVTLTAAQLIPLAQASQYTARVSVGFDQFANSFALQPHEIWTTLFPQIIHEGREAPTYVGIVALSGTALLLARGRFSWRTWYWLLTAILCFLLGLGDATPLAEIAYRIPLYDRFRVVARHLVFFSFALIALGSFGLAAVQRGELSRRRAAGIFAVVAIVATAVAGYLPTRPDLFEMERDGGLIALVNFAGRSVTSHLALWFVGLSAMTWLVWSRRRWPAIASLLIFSVLDFGNAQPVIVTAVGMRPPTLLPAALLDPSIHTQRIRRELEATHQRALPIGGSSGDPLVVGAFTRRWGVPSAGGYGPLLLNHLAQTIEMGNNGSIRSSVLLEQNRGLDVLAVRTLIVSARALIPQPPMEKHGYSWSATPLDLAVARAECDSRHPNSISLAAPPGVRIRAVALVAHLRCAEAAQQDSVVGSVSLVGSSGERQTRPLRAGIDVAEAYHGRPELAGRIGHRAARVFEASGTGNDLQATYLSVLEFDEVTEVRTIEVAETSLNGWLTLDRITVITDGNVSLPLDPLAAVVHQTNRFAEVARVKTSRSTDRLHDEDADHESELVLLENRRALPRAWMVSEVFELNDRDGLAALRHGSRPDGRAFNPAETAFVPPGSGVSVKHSSGLSAKVVVRSVEDGRVVLETTAAEAGFLVLSEMWYPGWTARVDGEPRDVVRTDYAVQGVPLTAGSHTVEFRFEPKSLRWGIGISAAALVIALGLLAVPARQALRSSSPPAAVR